MISNHLVGSAEVDLLDEGSLDQAFRAFMPEAVVHLAGLKAVGESVARPLAYYTHNLDSTFNLLRVMERHGVRKLVFSSSATVYGDQLKPPYREEDGPLRATNPYGQTKLVIEQVLRDLAIAEQRWQIALLRYFNPIGAHPSGLIGEDPRGVPSNLAPFITQVAVGMRDQLAIFGDDYATVDGTGERDYIHVQDLADGHVAALHKLQRGARAWNLGTGTATSVFQLLTAFEKAVGKKIPYAVRPRRLGDVAKAWADVSRAREELGWQAHLSIDQMARDAWNWQRKNPAGFAQ